MKDKIYTELRAHKSAKAYNAKGEESTYRDDRKSRVSGPARSEITDFTINEIRSILIEENIAKKFLGIIGLGKEANVYWIKDFANKFRAVKLFRFHKTSHNLNSMHARSNLSDTAKIGIIEGLCSYEYEMMVHLYQHNVRVPKPIERVDYMYMMDFLGTKRGVSPLLRDLDLRDYDLDPLETLDDILDQMDIMFNEAKVVHGDFSDHNLILHDNEVYTIDVLQAKQWHPRFATDMKIRKREAIPVLKRDVEAILNHFKKAYRLGYDPREVLNAMDEEKLEDYAPDELMSDYQDPESYEEFLKEQLYDY